MNNKHEIKIAVRNLVEFIFRSGNIDTGFFSNSRAVEGTKIHKKLQSSSLEDYDAEVILKYSIDYENFILTVEGRADGIVKNSEKIIVDEIKSTSAPISIIDENFNPLHWAQAKCYAYIYAKQQSISEIYVRLTYYQIDTDEIIKLEKKYTIEELSLFFNDLIDSYYVWAQMSYDWLILRDISIKSMEFPYDSYRKGQRKLAVAAYKTIVNSKNLFAQAPTGIGKTISTMFPTIKALGEGHTSKIFYLTAKTITRGVAQDALSLMRSKGLKIKSVTITAKDKVCFNESKSCTPEGCQHACGHFDRVNAAIMDILTNEDSLTREVIEMYARKHTVCPFEYTLDLTIWADIIICDYNYVFDPRVYLKRFFLEKQGDYVFLIDEAHNLVDRAREMYSAQLNKQKFYQLAKALKGQKLKILKNLNKINRHFITLKNECNEKGYIIKKDWDKDFYYLLRNFITHSEEYLLTHKGEAQYDNVLELYFECISYNRIYELYDEKFITYVEKTYDDVTLKLFCLDPSYLLSEALKRGKAGIFFSATLLPMSYHKTILGGSNEDYTIYLSSPFDIEKRCLMIANKISTKFRHREASYEEITKYINSVIESKSGNYLVFFPSYLYMNSVYETFSSLNPEVEIHLQTPSMTEEARDEFLGYFKEMPEKSSLGFCVLGGIYSEGIDLKYDRLIGAIIVGVGLPQICLERDIIKTYFDKAYNLGYEYAYMYPGMNKVLQAAGRVIRSETDTGVILLIDERFSYRHYQDLFPKEWFPHKKVDLSNMQYSLRKFWDSVEADNFGNRESDE